MHLRQPEQADTLFEQAGVAHWATRVDALQGLSKLLTAECQGDGGRLALESRPASKRLETVIAERLRDAHFKVVAAALRLLSGLIGVHPGPMAAHTSALLPLVRVVHFSFCAFVYGVNCPVLSSCCWCWLLFSIGL